MLCCLLFAVSLAMPIMTWRLSPDEIGNGNGKKSKHDCSVANLSIVVRDPPPDVNLPFVLSVCELFKKGRIDVDISCQQSRNFSSRLPSCGGGRDVSHLRFRFLYVPAADESYDDEVVYNFARICDVSQSCLKPTSGASSSTGRWLFTYVTDPGYVVRQDDLPKLTLDMPVCDNATTSVGNCGAS